MGVENAIRRLGAIVGPLGAGILVTANIAYPWGFYLFAGAAFLGLVSMLLILRRAVSPSDRVAILLLYLPGEENRT